MSASFQLFLVFLSAVVLRGDFAVGDKVPVLMWSNDESLSFPPAFVGHTVSQDDFRDLYLKKLLADNDIKTLAVFVQDKLTVKDVSISADVYNSDGEGGAYKHTKGLMSEYWSSFLSSVASPSSVLASVKEDFPGKIFTLQQPYNMADLHLESAGKNLVLVRLSGEHSDSMTSHSYLSIVDDILNNVTSQLQSLPGLFAAIYTGRKSHAQNSFQKHAGRHLLNSESTDNTTGLVLSIDNIFLMHASRVYINYNDNKNWTELSTDASSWEVTSGADCPFNANDTTSNSTCSIDLIYNKTVDIDGSELAGLVLKMVFTTSSGIESGFWYLKTFSMTYHNASLSAGDGTTVVLNEKFITWTPLKFSYHCHENPPIWPKKNETEFDPGLSLSFKAFQVQAFFVGNGFGYYNDCVGFFTIPIWSAIICSAVLIAILFFGVIMLMSIKTMDRLDDPKGKTISVTVTD